MKSANAIEIEVNDDHNGSLHFAPLQTRIRGRFDSSRLLKHDDGAGAIARQWDTPIPGQRLRLNVDDGTAEIVEPLNDDEHAGLREKIQAKGHRIAKGQSFSSVDVVTWAFWMRRAVESGSAQLVSGTFPKDLPGKPRTSFITSVNSEADPITKLAEAFDRQTEMLGKVLAALAAK